MLDLPQHMEARKRVEVRYSTVENPYGLTTEQLEDVAKLSQHTSRLCGNDLGTGKTFVAGELDRLARLDNSNNLPTLILSPIGAVQQWKEWMGTHRPDLTLNVCDPKRRKVWVGRVESADVSIAHWEGMRAEAGALAKVQWLHIIGDEAHRICGRKTQTAKSLKSLKKVYYKTALTGTACHDRPTDIWSILHWLYPERWTSYWRFFDWYVEWQSHPRGYREVVGYKNLHELRERIEPYFTRREFVGNGKVYTDLTVQLTPVQQKIYDDMAKRMLAEIDPDEWLASPIKLSQLMRLQQIAIAKPTFNHDEQSIVELSLPSSKISAVVELITDNPTEQFVVFSQFSKAIELLCQELCAADVPVVEYTGNVNHRQREENKKAFWEGEARVFAGTIGAGGTGLNLQCAHRMVFLDRSWSPAENLQAEGRCYRTGQDHPVQVIDVIAEGTVDLGRKALAENKWDVILEMLEGTSAVR